MSGIRLPYAEGSPAVTAGLLPFWADFGIMTEKWSVMEYVRLSRMREYDDL